MTYELSSPVEIEADLLAHGELPVDDVVVIQDAQAWAEFDPPAL